MSVIQADRLTKYYGRSRGVVDLTLGVEKGEVFGFLGPNGAGKTTTIRMLLGLIRATRGGPPSSAWTPSAMRRLCTPQARALVNGVEPANMALLTGVTVLMLAVALWGFQRRDLGV